MNRGGALTNVLLVESVLSEVLRWGVAVPLSMSLAVLFVHASHVTSHIDLPHSLRVDDVYRGMIIPKGSVVSVHLARDHNTD